MVIPCKIPRLLHDSFSLFLLMSPSFPPSRQEFRQIRLMTVNLFVPRTYAALSIFECPGFKTSLTCYHYPKYLDRFSWMWYCFPLNSSDFSCLFKSLSHSTLNCNSLGICLFFFATYKLLEDRKHAHTNSSYFFEEK